MKSVNRIILVLAVAALSFTSARAEEDEAPSLEISGSVDAYFKYDFAGASNSPTSFATDHNSMSIGMIDLGLTQTFGNATFVGELSFGPRGQGQSLPATENGVSGFNIQNLYASYALTDALSATAGYMGTFVGYEIISPTGNFNYSTSYLFSAGPFQNAGFKLDYSFSDRFAVMAGIFNDWNTYTDFNGFSDIGAQIYVSPVEGWDAYINFCTGPASGTIIDLTTGYQVTDAFYVGLNVADFSAAGSDAGYTGFALYPQYAFSDKLSLGYRGEYFMEKDVDVDGGTVNAWMIGSESVFSNTITLNFYHGPFTFSTEFRSDSAADEIFMDSDGAGSSSFSQFLLAAIYAF